MSTIKLSVKPVFSDSTPIPINGKVSIIKNEYTEIDYKDKSVPWGIKVPIDKTLFQKGILISRHVIEIDREVRGSLEEFTVEIQNIFNTETITFKDNEYLFKVVDKNKSIFPHGLNPFHSKLFHFKYNPQLSYEKRFHGGKRKSRRNRKSRKSRKNLRRSNRRR